MQPGASPPCAGFLFSDLWTHLGLREIHDRVSLTWFLMALLGTGKWMVKDGLFFHHAPFSMEVMDAAEAMNVTSVICDVERSRRAAKRLGLGGCD